MASRTLAKTDVGAMIVRSSRYGDDQIQRHSLREPDNRAALAFAFIERWGMVAGVPDGEDSAGRAKVRLAAPREVVERAFECAGLAWERAEEAGWMLSMPSIEEIERTDNGGPSDGPSTR